MALLIEREKSFYVSSNITGTTLPDGGIIGSDGSELSADKSTVFINLDSPGIQIPTGAVEITFRVEQASVWYTAPNISAALGNNRIDYLVASVAQAPIIIPDGLYSVEELNTALGRELVNRGQLVDGIVLSGEDSTQKVIITVQIGYQIDLTNFESLRGVIGWNSQVYPAIAPVAIESKPGENDAAFNNINEFTVRTDLVSEGIQVNNSGRNLLAVIPITSGSVNSQIIYQPNHPSIVEASEYRGKTINNFYISIADEVGVSVVQSEPWSVLLVLKYKYILTDQQIPLIDH